MNKLSLSLSNKDLDLVNGDMKLQGEFDHHMLVATTCIARWEGNNVLNVEQPNCR